MRYIIDERAQNKDKEGRQVGRYTLDIGRKEGRKEGYARSPQNDTSELAACNFSHQRTASPELVMRSLKHVTPDAAYWLTPDPDHLNHSPSATYETGLRSLFRFHGPFDSDVE